MVHAGPPEERTSGQGEHGSAPAALDAGPDRRRQTSRLRICPALVGGHQEPGLGYSRPAAAMNGFSSSINLAKPSNDTCCAPSLQASAGFGCTSTRSASAPMATAPLHMAVTRSARPAPWLGSITMGQCDSFLITGIAPRSSVLRV